MTIHDKPHPLAGRTVTLDKKADDPARHMVMPGSEYRIEDWWDRVSGQSWMYSQGNPAAIQYAMRSGMRCAMGAAVPSDDEVVYGHIDGMGHLLHVSELPGGDTE